MPESTFIMTAAASVPELVHWNPYDVAEPTLLAGTGDAEEALHLDRDEIGTYSELCFDEHVSKAILDEGVLLQPGEIATLRVYHSVAAKKAVVIKDDDILTKKELAFHAAEVAKATLQELQIWLDNDCFRKAFLKSSDGKPKNIMTSRYVSKWKWVKQPDGSMKKIIRMRLAVSYTHLTLPTTTSV